MFNPIIIVAIIVQSIVAKSSRKAGAIIGFVITTGILLWGISIYGDGGQIALFSIPLSEPIFFIACLVWYGFDTMEFLAAQKKATDTDQSETEALPTTITKTQIPPIALFFLWITTIVFANLGWAALYPLFISQHFSNISVVLTLSCGLIAGLLQWLLLTLIIPKADRHLLALWIPATMLGWASISIIFALRSIMSTIFDLAAIPSGIAIVFSVIRGGTIGLLQWLVLKKYSQVAFWLIPANIIDFVAASLLPGLIFGNIYIPSVIIRNVVIGVVGAIASSIAIFYISKMGLHAPNIETENIAESGWV